MCLDPICCLGVLAHEAVDEEMQERSAREEETRCGLVSGMNLIARLNHRSILSN